MSDIYNDLADFTRSKIKEKDLNYRLVAERSRGLIKHGTVYDIINERSKNPTVETLKGLALGLGESEEKIFALARGIKPNQKKIDDERFANIAEGYSSLTKEEKNSLQPLLLVLEATIFQSKSYIQIAQKKQTDLIKVPNLGKVNDKEPLDEVKKIA